MPDEDGKLNAEDQTAVSAWAEQHWKNRTCPISGHATWEVPQFLVQSPRFIPGGGLTIGGGLLPMLALVCSGCGYTMLINAIKVGILKPQAPKKEGQ